VDLERPARIAVASKPVGEHAFLALGRLEHDGRAAVAEEHGDVPVGQSIIGEMSSPPIRSAFFTTPDLIIELAVVSP
jgi:hypothetical protein